MVDFDLHQIPMDERQNLLWEPFASRRSRARIAMREIALVAAMILFALGGLLLRFWLAFPVIHDVTHG